MIVLKATPEQYEVLNGFTSGVNTLQFVQDGNGNWIVGLEVLEDPAFEEILYELEVLEQIEFVQAEEEGPSLWSQLVSFFSWENNT